MRRVQRIESVLDPHLKTRALASEVVSRDGGIGFYKRKFVQIF
jgi:hypothetical protein